MKTHLALRLSGLLVLALSGCKPESNNVVADEARRQLEATYAQQAADMQNRSEDLQKQLAELERSIKNKENAELKAKLDAISAENQKLMADADAARRKSEQLREQLAATPLMPVSIATPYVPPMAQPPVSQPWNDPSADYSMFYDSLNPYGRWLNIDGYGYAFRPSLSERSSWRPYVDGRWVSTNQGWAWDSREPFGWACYHYGRWVRLSRQGWVWIPGREWAPAWVSWRSGGGNVGWAPLPPTAGYGNVGSDCDARFGLAPTSYTFIQASHFGRSSYVNISLSIGSVTQFFNQTINVTNIVQVRQQNTNIFMNRGGPALDWIERRSGSRIERAPVQVVRTLERPVEFRAGRTGAPSFIAAPLPSGRADRTRELPKNAERVSSPTMVDVWKDVPSAQRNGFREAITRQAREPQPKPVIAVSAPEVVPVVPPQPEVRPAILAPNMPSVPDRIADRDRGNNQPPVMPKLEITQDAANQANLARRDAERRMQGAEEARQKQVAEQQASMAAQQKEITQKQAEAAAMRAQLVEQEKKDLAMRENQAADMSEKEAAALKEKQAAEMAAQQKELARKEAEAAAMAQRQEAMAAQAEAAKQREMQVEQQQAESRKQAELEAAKARDAAMAQEQRAKEELTRRQQELTQRQQDAAAMRAQQETTERQREAAMQAQRDAAMRAQQEVAERQRDAAMQAQRDAAMRAQQEAAERQREAAVQAQRDAAMRAQQEAAERQREAAMQAQRDAAERAKQEAASRAQEEAARAQQEAAQRAAAEEAARRAAQPPPPGQ